LEYLGRTDLEIKIRGQRVETEAIEDVLRKFPEIRQALVAGVENSAGRLSLVAYIIPDGPHRLSVDAIRKELGRIFSKEAIPTKFVFLDSFPVTASGKIDRAAFPVPSTERPSLGVPCKEPSDVIEIHLKKIWESILDVRPIGVRDDFFDLGGDSLLATEMLFNIESLFGVALTLNTLWLESTTIEELASHLRGQAQSELWKNAVPLQTHGGKPPLFCVHTGGGNLWSYRRLAEYFEHDRPIFGLPARGVDGSRAVDVTVEGMARNCVEMMRRQQPNGPYLIVGYSSGGLIAYETARQIEALGSKVGLLGVIDSPPSVNSIPATFEFFRMSLVLWHPRLIQERLYQVVLGAFGLSRWRALRTIGEAHRWAVWRYRAGAYLGSITLVRSVTDSSLRASDWGWDRLVAGPVDVHTVSAPGHIELMQDPYVREVAEVLRAAADRADAAEAHLEFCAEQGLVLANPDI
jgi:thioesterase domain-containing protein/acyl carrier protein